MLLVAFVAGTGKSALITVLYDEVVKLYGFASCVVSSPTGLAAYNVGGTTVHCTLGWNPHSPEPNMDKAASRLAPLKLLILDEVSMVGTPMLRRIRDMLCRINPGPGEPDC